MSTKLIDVSITTIAKGKKGTHTFILDTHQNIYALIVGNSTDPNKKPTKRLAIRAESMEEFIQKIGDHVLDTL